MQKDADTQNSNEMAGCGMGLYAMILMFICGLGLIGMCSATVALMNSEPNEARNLVHGSEVQVWRLQPMRDAGLLQLTEVPEAWHDESPRFDGTTSCLITASMVARLENSEPQKLLWSEIIETKVTRTEASVMTVTIRGEATSFDCHFGPNEGADRFLRMVETERQRTGLDSTPTSEAN